MLRKFFSHTAIYGIAPQIPKIATVVSLPLITPYLSSKDYGIYGILTAVAGSVSAFSVLGLNIVLSNIFIKSPNQFKWLWRQIYGFLNLWSIPYGLITSLVIWFFIPVEAKEQTLTIILLNILPIVLFGPSMTLGSLYYQLKQKPFQIALRSSVVGLSAVLLNIFFIRQLRMGYMGWFWSNAISQFLYQASYFFPLRYYLKLNPIYNFKWRTIKKQLTISLPTIPHYYSSYLLTSFDRVILKMLKVDIGDIGKYNAANTPGNLFASLSYAANQAISPLLLQSYKDNDRKAEVRLTFVVTISFLTLTSVLCLFLKELLPLIIRSQGLKDIYPIAIIIIMAYNYRPMYVAANNRLFYYEKTKALLKVTTVAATISVVMNFCTIYAFGYTWAAITLFVSFMYMGYSGFFIKEFTSTGGSEFFPARWLILTIMLTIFVYYAVELSMLVKLVVSFVLISLSFVSVLYFLRKSSKVK